MSTFRNTRAEFIGPGLSQEEYRGHGFNELEPDETVVGAVNNANLIEHVDENGNIKYYNARNHHQNKYDPENLLEAQNITDETKDNEFETEENRKERMREKKEKVEKQGKIEREAMNAGGKYRFIRTTHEEARRRTGGAFMFFLKEDFPGSLEELGIYKKSEWEKLSDIEVFNSCLIHCFRNHPNYERLLYSKGSVFTLLSKKVFETICDIVETNITVRIISVLKEKVKKNGFNESKNRAYKFIGKGGKKYSKTFEICLLQGHYFPFIEDTGYTTKYIKQCVWKDKEKDEKKLKTKYGLYSSKTSPLNSFNLVKLMIEQQDDYFDSFQSEMFREPRKENLDEKIIFKDYEQFDVDFDCKEWEGNVEEPEFEEVLEADVDEEEIFNNELDNLKYVDIKLDTTKKLVIWHADIETTTDGKFHVPYLMACDNNEGTDKQYFWGVDCVKKCLTYISKKNFGKKCSKTLIKFQNLGYDINFIREHLTCIHNTVEPSKSKVYRLQGSFKYGKKSITLTFVDQYPQIPMPLRDYEKSFNLRKGKFADFSYSFYNSRTVKHQYLIAPYSLYPDLIKIFPEEYIIKDEDRKRLIIKHMAYAIDYCQQDVETKRQGWNKMYEQVWNQLGLDYNKYMTISNLSKAYCEKEGCYKGVNLIRGKAGVFIRKCVVGGRTMSKLHDKKFQGIHILNEREDDELQDGFDYDYEDEEIQPTKELSKFVFDDDGNIMLNENYDRKLEKIKRKEFEIELQNISKFISPRPKLGKYEKGKRVVDLDENSLYPTAIIKLLGYPIGKAKNISKEELKSKSFMKYADEFYLKILITKVNKKLHFPCLTTIGERGERLWTNDMEGKEIYVDRITLEDLEKYHEIEYECKAGLMFTEGHNPKIGEVIKGIYELRKMYKKEGNPLQLLYKLMLNVAYGKTIQKPEDTKVIWRADKTTSVRNLIRIYGESIQSIETPKDGKNIFKAKVRIGIINHWAMPHCGSLVLSQSKRIMNEIMVPYGEDIFYTDTDSMFMTEERYLELKKNKPELFGNELGQLKEEKHFKGEEVRIVKAMFLAPKVYWIREENEKGETFDKIVMKGIPQSSIFHVLNQKFDGNPEKLFYALIKRKRGVLFDLLDGGDKIRMDFSNVNTVLNLDIFGRRIGGFR